ncbi:MAG: DUF523 domain-containing protein [Thermodesulfobacteriota bacterium]|nr:DUF523 domain-containing protein [Thermodesulfobacteriota bacterium]
MIVNDIMKKRIRPVYLVSACLMGLKTRYDGLVKPCPQCRAELEGAVWIPVCPEQLGGLATPRVAADLTGGNGRDVLDGRARVITREGNDVTGQFIDGAKQVLAIAMAQPVSGIFLKSKSPSCGVHSVLGVTAALLKEHGFLIREF